MSQSIQDVNCQNVLVRSLSIDVLIYYFSAGTPNSEQAPSAFGEDESEQNSEDPPTVVVYIVNPFSNSSREESFPSYVGLLRCIADILPDLTESNKKNVVFQVLSTVLITLSLYSHSIDYSISMFTPYCL